MLTKFQIWEHFEFWIQNAQPAFEFFQLDSKLLGVGWGEHFFQMLSIERGPWMSSSLLPTAHFLLLLRRGQDLEPEPTS